MIISSHGYTLSSNEIEMRVNEAVQKTYDYQVLDQDEQMLLRLINSIHEQRKALAAIGDETAYIIYYVDNIGFNVEQGLKRKFKYMGSFLADGKRVETIECKRRGTKKFESILSDLQSRYPNAVVKMRGA